jgi:hypothetical protein
LTSSKKTCGFPNHCRLLVPVNTTKKHAKACSFVLVDDQGLETDLRGQKWGFFKEKAAKIARFESRAPIMPQNAPV